MDDLSRCVGVIDGLPDLRFRPRRGPTFPFTGEQLTRELLSIALAKLQKSDASLATVDLTCLPSRPPEPALPGYTLALGCPSTHPLAEAHEGLLAGFGRTFDRPLSDMNQELASEHESNRLAPTRAFALPYETLAASLGQRTACDGNRSQRSWEPQFKLTPLNQRVFKDVDWSH